MPAISELSPEQWKEVEILAVAGMPVTEIAEKFGIEPNPIYLRSSREEWPVPSRLERMRKELASKEVGESSLAKDKERQAGAILAESLVEYGQKGALIVAKGVLPVLERSFSPESALAKSTLESWKDAGTAFGLLAKATGLDKPTQAVQVNLGWGGGASGEEGPIEEV